MFAVTPAYADEPTNTCPNGQILHQYESATGTVSQNGTPTPTNPIEPTFYQQGDMVLRKIDDTYYDSYDATTGKITRRVGVKVLDGTEEWNAFWEHGYMSRLTDMLNGNALNGMCNYFSNSSLDGVRFGSGNNDSLIFNQVVSTLNVPTVDDWKSWLAEQYAAGTPVTVYYPLATPVEETVTQTTYCADAIKIATTAYNDAQFAPVEQALETAVTTIKDVVANTIVQADAIQNLQDTKQTMPDANGTNGTCPRFRQCLLIETASGTPQWFPIIDPFKDFFSVVLANNSTIPVVNTQSRYAGDLDLCRTLPQTDEDATSTSVAKCTSVENYKNIATDNPEHGALKQTEWGYEFKAADLVDNPNGDSGIVYGISKCVSTEIPTPEYGTIEATSTQLNHALWDARPTTIAEAGDYRLCWCKMTSIVYDGKVFETPSSPWLFDRTSSLAANCARDCARNCLSRARDEARYRSVMMNWAVE